MQLYHEIFSLLSCICFCYFVCACRFLGLCSDSHFWFERSVRLQFVSVELFVWRMERASYSGALPGVSSNRSGVASVWLLSITTRFKRVELRAINRSKNISPKAPDFCLKFMRFFWGVFRSSCPIRFLQDSFSPKLMRLESVTCVNLDCQL